MIELQKPTEAYLAPYVTEATEGANQTVDEFIAQTTANMRHLLMEDPLMYRAYGPWWWLLKKILLDAGMEFFPGDEESTDDEQAEYLSYGRTEYDLVAIYLYADRRMTDGSREDQWHVVELANGDSYDYPIADDWLEGYAMNQAG